ncbi:MAG: multiheme c-type cytochrome [Planctomycetota bacterium]
MRYFRFYFLIIVLAAAAFVLMTCKQKTPPRQKPNVDDEPLLLDEPPLLLEDGNEELPPPEGPVADNSRCHVCHINYADEELAVEHARANISCEQCHGSCDAHCSDEDNVTPPDIMYPLEKINSSCMACHSKDTIDIQPHEPILAGTATEKKYCTDCHGKHRLSYRTRKWDKTTGELVEDDKVRMTTDEMPNPQ